MERERELRHFLHYEHPLIFNEELDKDRRGRICSGCRKQMWGPNYSCKECIYSRKECIWFNLHKSCAELPRELEHPLHPKHPLLLICKYFSEIKCGGCNREEHQRGLIYSCSHCNFNLQSKCASLPLTVQAEIHHQHPLTLVRKSLSFTCDACGEEGKGMFYLCAICPFLVHLECSSCPLLVKHIRHAHPLHLTNSLQQPQLNHSDHRLCLLCVKKVNTNYMVYCCSTCDFVTHLHCGANELLWDKSKDTEPIEDPYVVKKSKLGENKVEIAVEIKHFNHEHDLKLIDEQLENDEKCDGCMWPIYPPFYTCSPCRFFLHKSCVELSRKKSHPLHGHPLILLPKAPYSGECFSCNACQRKCNGFVYHCDKCQFDLDVQCSLMPDIFKHEGHEHQLILDSASNSEECSSCDSKGIVFRCAHCVFSLNFKCATLPRTTKYRPHEQSFTLCYKGEDACDGEYYCDICEEPRNLKYWFYYCGDLEFPAHPDCILGEKPLTKFGKTYMFDTHEHPLTFVDKSKGVHPPCNKCGHLCNDWTFECVKCNFNLHRYPQCLT
ncbi:uncharacterized protein LOC132171629 [Corylus avellana]|uniref:uncharacterized protein LOC132171629 n=1 Tax=Corylus avellana TaxID=13451 RepID=UPI00286B89D1|nr:uncharacterized protein LOC132171629 [Corylus avellana]